MADGSIPPGAAIAPGTQITGFDYVLPASKDEIAGQVQAALLRGLPEALERKALRVIANGPSAKDAPLDGETLALNGALELFFNAGRVPTYWAACDSQGFVADFLPDAPPKNITYFVASRCHPGVFDKLRGCDVRVWHPKEGGLDGRRSIPRNCSITLSALWLMFELGYTDFDVWGWDACYGADGSHHAGSQVQGPAGELEVNYGGKLKRTPVRQSLLERLRREPREELLEIEGGRNFHTSRTWVAEASAAEQFFHLAHYFDMGVTVHGDGMIKAAQAFVAEERAKFPENL